tara:strand:- start:459 stop:914 length:456 start_codon:yes stop_codon:yes gene_type:complete
MGKITGKPNGRPLLYESSEDMQIIIDEYFDYCDNRLKQVHSKEGESYGISNPEPYTMSGLAYALGMDRRTLIDYKNRDEFILTIQRARNKVEADVERRMSDRDTFTPGLIFNAKNNFDWKDKSEQDVKVQAVQPLFDIERVKLEDNISDKI